MGISANQYELVVDSFYEFLRADIERSQKVIETPISELGLDSLDFFEFITGLEDELGVRMEFESLDDQVCLRDILKALS